MWRLHGPDRRFLVPVGQTVPLEMVHSHVTCLWVRVTLISASAIPRCGIMAVSAAAIPPMYRCHPVFSERGPVLWEGAGQRGVALHRLRQVVLFLSVRRRGCTSLIPVSSCLPVSCTGSESSVQLFASFMYWFWIQCPAVCQFHVLVLNPVSSCLPVSCTGSESSVQLFAIFVYRFIASYCRWAN